MDHLGGSSSITTLLDAIAQPAFLVSEIGQVLFANRSARSLHAARPPWLAALLEQGSPPTSNDRATVSPFEVTLRDHQKTLWLVVERSRAPAPGEVSPAPPPPPEAREPLGAGLFEALSPALRELAPLLLEGLSEREIAARTGRRYATVRTYIQTIYRKLAVHSREELIAKAIAHERGLSGDSGS
jgi:DNA-binding CsgD family transcriptional regulator